MPTVVAVLIVVVVILVALAFVLPAQSPLIGTNASTVSQRTARRVAPYNPTYVLSAEVELRDRLQAALGAHYRVKHMIGAGAFGAVFEVQDRALHRILAVKILRHGEPDQVVRFQREAVILANLRHPHIVPLYFVGAAERLPFIVMPRLQGHNLRAVIERQGQLALEEIFRITSEVSSALDAAHAARVVHRDVKPENIFLDGTGQRVQLTDFGIAKVVAIVGEGNAVGTIIGTAEYMSPEQCSGTAIDGRSDVYSLGCVVYEMLTGVPPFTGDLPLEVFRKHIFDKPPDLCLRRSQIPREVENSVLKALAKSPEDRFPTAGAFASGLTTART